MKVMLLGNTYCLENAYSMIQGLKELGLDAGYFGYRSFKAKYGENKMKEVMFGLIKKNKPEWIFVQFQFNPIIHPIWFKQMKEISPNSKISLMSVDMREELDAATLQAGKYVDFCFQKGNKDHYIKKGLNCKILQQGYSDKLFYKKNNTKKELDLCFAGGFYKKRGFPGTGERTKTISYLFKHIPNSLVIGSNWEQILTDKRQRCGQIDLGLINEIYNKTKIVLNINHFNNIEHYFSVRMVEGMGSGSFMLTRYVPGLELYFKNHEDLVWFYSLEDCFDLAQYYLKNGKEREKIAKKGLIKVQNEFRWESIMKKAHNIIFNNDLDHDEELKKC